MTLFISVRCDEEPCPSLQTTIDELDAVNDIIFRFQSRSNSIQLRQDEVANEYLEIIQENSTHYVIRLKKPVDLNEMNPSWFPVSE